MVVSARSRDEFVSLPTALVVLFVGPMVLSILYLALSSGGGGGTLEAPQVIAAGLAVAGLSSTMSASSLLANDQVNGTLAFVVTAPRGHMLVWCGRIAVVAGIGVLQGAVGTAAAFVVIGRAPSASMCLAVLGLLVIASAVSLGFGLTIGAVGLIVRDSMLLPNTAEQLVPVLCGAIAPVAVLWPPLAMVANVIPLTHAIEVGRNLDASWAVNLGGLMAAGIGGVVWAAIGVATWVFLQRRARRTGAIESMAIG
ncbi:ABC transporter permease [Gulosibacter sediminis]|uniref:ABC transporter permease n=1 Tax=Gulosibacter sediminis TaxID=1729695 RepID=UPI0024A86E12|nr:ABC transporter permease [Gulosibacter sediminis]